MVVKPERSEFGWTVGAVHLEVVKKQTGVKKISVMDETPRKQIDDPTRLIPKVVPTHFAKSFMQ